MTTHEESKTGIIRPKLFTEMNGEEIMCLLPAYGPLPFQQAGLAVERDGLSVPTMADAVAFLRASMSLDNEFSNPLADQAKKQRLWTYTGLVITPGKEYLACDDLTFKNGKVEPFERDSVQGRIESGLVRTISTNFPAGRISMTPHQLSQHPLVVALAGEEGANTLAEIADEQKRQPYLSFMPPSPPGKMVGGETTKVFFNLGFGYKKGRVRIEIAANNGNGEQLGYACGRINSMNGASGAE